MKIKVYSLVVLVVTLMTSCATMKVTHYGVKNEKVESITLYSTMIGGLQQPVLPLLDAASFNSMTNSIADQIMDMQKQNVDKCRSIIASGLEKTFKCQVVFGDSLHSLPGFQETKSSVHSKSGLRLKSDHFPLITLASDDVNPFPFENGKVAKYFKNPANYKNIVAQLGKNVNSDMVAVSYSHLSVVGIGPFGAYGMLRLDTYLYLFDKKGDLLSEAHTWSKPTSIAGKKLDEYRNQLNNLSLILDPVLNKVVLNYQLN